MAQSKSLFVPIEETDFDWNSIIVEKPVMNKRYKCSFSKVFVMDKDGQKKEVSFELAKQDILGLSHSYKYEKRKDRNIEDINGIQVNYPLTSFDTIAEPTEEEEETRDRIDQIIKTIGSTLQKFYQDKDTQELMPELSKAKKKLLKDEPDDLVKVPYVFSKNKDTGEEDQSKPLCMYLNFKTSGSGSKLRCHTVFKGRKRNETFRDYLWDKDRNNRACARISLRWESIYFGAHGTSDFIASARLVVQQIKLTKPILEFEPVQDEEIVFSDSDYEDDDEDEAGFKFRRGSINDDLT